MKLKHRTGAYKEHVMDLAYSFDLDREDMLELLASWNGSCPAGERIPLSDGPSVHPRFGTEQPTKNGWYWARRRHCIVPRMVNIGLHQDGVRRGSESGYMACHDLDHWNLWSERLSPPAQEDHK